MFSWRKRRPPLESKKQRFSLPLSSEKALRKGSLECSGALWGQTLGMYVLRLRKCFPPSKGMK